MAFLSRSTSRPVLTCFALGLLLLALGCARVSSNPAYGPGTDWRMSMSGTGVDNAKTSK